jgi:hypothetical protein
MKITDWMVRQEIIHGTMSMELYQYFHCINVGPTTPTFLGINPSKVLFPVDIQLGLINLESSFMRTKYVILSS